MRTIALATALCALAVAASCGWKTDGVARLDEIAPLPDASDAGVEIPDVDLGDVGGSGLPGRWAVKLTEPGKVKPTGMDGWGIVINDLFVADLTADAAVLTFCDQVVESESTMGLSTTPRRLIDALAAAKVALPLAGDGTFAPPVTAWLWGVRGLASPAGDPLPADAGDAHAWDQDGDGNPGVTVDVKSPDGQRYMVRRSVWTFEAGAPAADQQTIEGRLSFTVEEKALGATSDLLTTVAPIEAISRGSKYQLRRVNAGFGCADLLGDGAWRAIFPTP
jgi:hypothetical protein